MDHRMSYVQHGHMADAFIPARRRAHHDFLIETFLINTVQGLEQFAQGHTPRCWSIAHQNLSRQNEWEETGGVVAAVHHGPSATVPSPLRETGAQRAGPQMVN